MYRFSSRSLLLIIVLLLIPITLLFRLNQKPTPSAAAWWNETWAYRRSITVTNSGSAQNNVYITLSSLDTSSTSRFQSDGGDIRATKQDGTLLDYYIVSGIGTTNTTLHINFDTLIAGSSTIYLYYGNPSAANGFSASDFPSAAASSSPGTPATEESSPGPILYYSFDEGIGTSVSNSGIGGTITGVFGSGSSAPTWTDGYSSKAISLDSTDYLNLSSPISLGDGTISAWVKFDTKSSLVAGNNYIEGYWLYWTGGLLYINWGNDHETFNDPFETNVWTHIATTRSGTNVSLYKNGVLQQTKDFGTSGTATIRCLGRLYCDTGSYQKFDGLLDEFKIYSRALSADEIKQEYNRTAATQIGSLSTGGGNTAPATAGSQQYCIPGDTATCSPPIAEWKFDEGVGTTAYDTSGNSNHAAFTAGSSAPTWTTGKTGKALSFDGNDDYIDVGSGGTFDNSEGTFETWFKTTAGSGIRFIFGDRNPSSSSQYLQSWIDNGAITTRLTNTSTYNTSASASIYNDNKWHFLTITWGSDGLRQYVDSIIAGTNPYTGTWTSNANMVLGTTLGYQGSNNFQGSLDNVRFYNYARTPGQILLDMNSHPPISSPLLHYKFDEGNGTTVTNSGIGGTITGTFGSGSSAPTWTDGHYSKGLSFGGNDYLSATGFVGTGSNPYTISCWLKASNLNGTYQGCFAIGTSSTRTSAYIGINSANVLGGGYYAANLATNVTPTIGQWYHLVQTYSGGTNGHTIIYVDGVAKIDSTTNTPNLTTGTYAVGYIFNPYWFYGSIDEVKYYNYALTPDEVRQDYNRGTAAQFGSLASGTGNTASPNASSQEYCVPGDASTCSAPIAEWKFDEKIGTTAYNNVGTGNTGTFGTGTSSPGWTIGKIGQALSFDGNDYVKYSTNTLYTKSAVTISAWFKTSDSNGAIISDYNTSSAYVYKLIVKNSYLAACVGSGYPDSTCNSNTNQITSTQTVNNNQWHHASLTYNGSLVSLYLDGQSIGTTEKTGSLPATGGTSSFIGVQGYDIGSGPVIQESGFLTGLIDHVRIYDYARTPAQIALDYNRGGPVGHWKMDDCQGTQIADWSGNSNHGTLSVGASGTQNSVGTCQVGTSAAWTAGATGKWNSSLNFDGTDDYVSINNSPSLQNIKTITISAWVKPSSLPGTYARIVDKTRTSAFAFGISSQKALFTANIGSTDQVPAGANTTIPIGTFTHLTVTYDGSTIKYYFNGAPDGTATPSPTGDLGSNTNNLFLGAITGASSFFPGQLDDIRIYNYAMTTDQIKQLYNNGAITFN